MHPLLLAILLGYLFIQAFENILCFFNLRYLEKHGAEIPLGFENQVDKDTLVKMRDYTLENGRFNYITTFFDIIVTLIFIFGGLLNWYNNWITGHNWPFVLSGTLFFLFLTYGESLIKIPFTLYNTFHIEQKYGFNTQTFGLWCLDTIKSLVLSTVLYGLILLAAFWLVKALPHLWWLAIWAFLFIFSIFLLYISPYVIEPLFNKFTPIEDEALEKKIKQVMGKAGLSISRVFQMDASKRSSHSNAYFSGIGHVKRIVLFDTLLKDTSSEELIAILAHEAGHWKKKHIIKRIAIMEIFAFIGIYLVFRLVESDSIATIFAIDQATLPVKLMLTGFAGSLLLFPFKPLSSLYSRRHENEADNYAVTLTENPGALARALVKLGRHNLANLHPHPVYSSFYYSHPPLADRVKRLLVKA